MIGGLESSESTKPVEQTRERLTDEQMGNLISAVGNHEAKAITLLAMRDGNIYSKSGLHRALLFYQGEKIGWGMSRPIPFSYCLHSLAPIGLVTKETLNPDLSTYGFQITDYGRKAGIPFCGLMLDWAERHDVSLNLLWGQTSSSSHTTQTTDKLTGEKLEFRKRAPITTLKILYELLTTPDLPIRRADLGKRLDDRESTILGHLKRLSSAGLIEYQSIEANKPFSAYRLTLSPPAGELQIYPNSKRVPQAILSILQAHPNSYLTYGDINKLLPTQIKAHWTTDNYAYISAILSNLKKGNYVESKQFSMDLRSEINLNGDQKIILTELLEILCRFQDQEPEIITKGWKLAAEIINHPASVSDILRKVKETSPQVNQTLIPETLYLISYTITSSPGITNKEIQKLLEKEGKKLGTPQIQHLTAILETNKSVRVNKEGKVKRFFPKDTSSQLT